MNNIIKPTSRRLKQPDAPELVSIADPDGGTWTGYKSQRRNSIDRLLEKKRIDGRQYKAFTLFNSEFLAAGFERFREKRPTWQRIDGAQADDTDHRIDRRNSCWRAMNIFEHQEGKDACWFVLGLEMSIREWADRTRHGGQYGGNGITNGEAQGHVIGCLGGLAQYYRVPKDPKQADLSHTR